MNLPGAIRPPGRRLGKGEASNTWPSPLIIPFKPAKDKRKGKVEGVIEHISLTDNPARLGSIWEHMADLLGRRLLTSNECNVCETNRKFGWITGKPISSQITLSLRPDKDSTKLAWRVESEAAGIAQLAETLLVKETKDRIQESFNGLNIYLLRTQV